MEMRENIHGGHWVSEPCGAGTATGLGTATATGLGAGIATASIIDVANMMAV